MANALNLSSYASAELTFSWYIESSFDSGEYIALDVYNGTSWIELRRLRGNVEQENTWHQETVNLGPDVSSSTRIRFRAIVDSSSEDANVDNVRIVASGSARR